MKEYGMNRLDFYPTIDEILTEAPSTKCPECGRLFMNSSACRFHQLKHHLNTNRSKTNEKRIAKRTFEEPRVTMAFHCPDPSCSSKKEWFDGLRNLRQHYFRSHAEKKFSCEMCGFKAALEKDIKYHMKARCSVVKKKKDIKKNVCERRSSSESRCSRYVMPAKFVSKDSEPTTSSGVSTSTHTILQPVYFIVNPENVHSVIETIQKSLGNSSIEMGIAGVSSEASTQVRTPFVEEEQLPMYATASTSTSFAAHYDQEPTTFCERGTMMNGQEPLDYFSPPYGEEFGDIPSQQKPQQQFDYSDPSTSQPQTRSFGTMFENVTTCNTGTSMIDESYVSEFLRDIETQTPSYMVQDTSATSAPSSSSPNSNSTASDWMSPWRSRNI